MLTVILRRKGQSFRKIATRLDRSLDFVKTWNDRFKALGAGGLLDKQAPPPRPRLAEEQRALLRARILAGPRPTDGVQVFTVKGLSNIIKIEYGVVMSTSAISVLLKRMGLSRIKPRTIHGKNEQIQMQNWVATELPLF